MVTIASGPEELTADELRSFHFRKITVKRFENKGAGFQTSCSRLRKCLGRPDTCQGVASEAQILASRDETSEFRVLCEPNGEVFLEFPEGQCHVERARFMSRMHLQCSQLGTLGNAGTRNNQLLRITMDACWKIPRGCCLHLNIATLYCPCTMNVCWYPCPRNKDCKRSSHDLANVSACKYLSTYLHCGIPLLADPHGARSFPNCLCKPSRPRSPNVQRHGVGLGPKVQGLGFSVPTPHPAARWLGPLRSSQCLVIP